MLYGTQKPKQEGRAEEHIRAQGGEVFLPQRTLEKMRKGKRVNVIESLFPGYLFVNVEGCEHLIGSIQSTRGVRQLLHFGIEPIEIRQDLIDDWRHRCGDLNQHDGILDGCRQVLFKEGQVVEITSGPFRGCQAIFKQFDGEQRTIILLNQQQEFLIELEQL